MMISFGRHGHRHCLSRILTTLNSRLYHSAATSFISNNTLSKDIEYCRDLVKKHDNDGYLCSLFLPDKSVMTANWILRAFNIETARIRESVSNEQLGRMRMLWWKESIESLYEKSAIENSHPVLNGLAYLLQESECKLSKSWFIRLLNARESNLLTRQYQTLEDMELYAENTWSSLLYLTLESMNIRDITADHIASHIGKALGIITLIKATPYLAIDSKQPQYILPANISATHNLSAEKVVRFIHATFRSTQPDNKNKVSVTTVDAETGENLKKVIHECAILAYRHLETANDHIMAMKSNRSDMIGCLDDVINQSQQHQNLESSGSSRTAFPVFLNSIPARLYLKALEKSDFNMLEAWSMQKRGQWRLPLHLLYSSIRKTL